MPLQEVCVLCAEALPIPRRADARYCRRSTCRVQAFRARRQGGAAPASGPRTAWRLPAADSVFLRAGVGTQLAAFRVLRQTQKHAAEVAAQLVQAGKDAAHQRREHEKEAQAWRGALDAPGQQTALREIQARVEAQTAAAAEATARWTRELQRATERAETQRAAAAEATRGREAEHKRAAALQEQLTETVRAASTQRAASELTRSQDHILQLCEVRAAAYSQVEAAWIAGVQAGRSEAQPQLPSLLAPLDHASGAAPAPRTPTPASPSQPAQPPPDPRAIGRRSYPMLEKAMKRF